MFNKIIGFGSMSCLILGMLAASPAWAAGIQKEVIKRDRLRCGVSGSGIAQLERLYCRAVALAVLGDATKIDIIQHTNTNRYQAARHDPAVDPNQWVDVSFVTNRTSVGFDGGTQGLTFTSPIMMNRTVVMGRISSTSGQSVLSNPSAFMAITTPAAVGAYFVANPNDKLCASPGANVLALYVSLGVPAASIIQSGNGPTNYSADNGGANGVPCHAVTSSELTLIANVVNQGSFLLNVTLEHTTQAGYTRSVKKFEVDGISLQADKGDQKWDALINAIVNGVQTAALYGVDSSNVTVMCDGSRPVPHENIAHLLGIANTVPQAGDTVGLRNDWACDVIAQLGNYDQFWDAVTEAIFATSGVTVDQTTFYNGFNQLLQDPSGRPTGGLIVPMSPSAF